MKVMRRVLVSSLVVTLSALPGWSTARLVAQDRSGLPDGPSIQAETLFAGVPTYSVMKTVNESLSVGFTPVDAFAPVAGLPCPATAGPNGCTIRVTVSSQLAVPVTANGRMELAIKGPGTLAPAALVAVVSQSTTASTSAYSMQWVKKNVPAGSTVTVTMKFNVTAGTGSAGFRTMSIDILNGLL